jgi:hypothetical protein
MGDPQLDDSIANLERFNQSLASLTPRLGEAGSDLATQVAALQALAGELQTKMDAARSAVDAIGGEGSTFALAAETEADAVGDMALNDLDSALTTLDGSVRELAESVPREIAARADGLEQDLQSLQGQGFGPLHQMMNSLARAAFGNWAAAAEEDLDRLDQQIDIVIEQFKTHGEQLNEAERWNVQNTEVRGWSPVSVASTGVETRIPAVVVEAPLATDLTTLQEAAGQQADAATLDLRTQLASAVQEVSEQISYRTLALVDTLGTVVDACELAEHNAGEAEQEATSAVQRAAALVDLAERMETAEGELQQIQIVLQGMNTA